MTLALEQLRNALLELDQAGAAQSTTTEAPIFVGGTAWRCGSTLLQRIIMSDPRALIWGEPIEDKAIVGRMAEALSKPGKALPFWVGDRLLSNLQAEWTTLLWPDAADLKAGLRAMFDTWLAAPARRRGFQEWGLKEVRWSGGDMLFLRWLYPASRVFLIVRDPIQSYRSLLKYYYTEASGYYVRWPDQRVFDAESYANYWSDLVLGWIELRRFESYTLIDYDDLVAGKIDLSTLGAANGLQLNGDVALSEKVNGAAIDKGALSKADVTEMKRIAELAGSALPALVSKTASEKTTLSQADEDQILKITEKARARLADLLSGSN